MRRRPARSARSAPHSRWVATLTAAVLAAGGLVASAQAANAADTDLARNGTFEAGLSGWSCTAGSGAAVTTPVHGGSGALKATPAGSDNAKCSQTVTVKPDSAYTLSAWVRGSYVYLGASGTGTTDVSTWTQSAPDWQKLTTSFRTGPATTSVTVYTNGWYGTGAYYADDLTLVGPGGAPVQTPAVPTGLRAGAVTSSSVALSWSPVQGATGYAVYRNGTKAADATGTSATVSGLNAATAYSFQVAATNTAGASALSPAVTAT
ncbi:chitinase, partial [Streptomyces sp. 150FB]